MPRSNYDSPKGDFDNEFVDDSLLARLFNLPEEKKQTDIPSDESSLIKFEEDTFGTKYQEVLNTFRTLRRFLNNANNFRVQPDVIARKKELFAILSACIEKVEEYKINCDELSFEERMREIQIITETVEQTHAAMNNWKAG